MLRNETTAIGKLLERTMMEKYGPANLKQHYMVMDTICDATQVLQAFCPLQDYILCCIEGLLRGVVIADFDSVPDDVLVPFVRERTPFHQAES